MIHFTESQKDGCVHYHTRASLAVNCENGLHNCLCLACLHKACGFYLPLFFQSTEWPEDSLHINNKLYSLQQNIFLKLFFNLY